MTFEYEGGDEPVVGTADPELELHVQDEKAVFALNDNGDVFKNVLTNPHNVAPIVWTSSDETVATVDQEGTATFKGVGTTIISAAFAGDDTYKAQTVSYTLQIKDPVRVEPDLSFDEAEYSYTFGNGKFESPKVNNPKALTGLKWSSSDESVATVKWNGEVVPVKGGTVDEPASTVITVVYENEDKTVKEEASYTLKLVKGEGSVSFGDVTAFECTMGFDVKFPQPVVEPATIPVSYIKYTSSDDEIASTVRMADMDDDNQLLGTYTYYVYPEAEGEVTISVALSPDQFVGENLTASYTLTVKTLPDPQFEIVVSPENAITGPAYDEGMYGWVADGTSSASEYELNVTLPEPYDTYAWIVTDYNDITPWNKTRKAVEVPESFVTKEELAELNYGVTLNFETPVKVPVINAPNGDEPAAGDEVDDDEAAEIYPVEIIIIPGIGDKFNPDTSYAIYSKVKYDATTTGVAAMEIATGKAEYYNLQGVRVANPEKGAYVKVQNGKAAKVML